MLNLAATLVWGLQQGTVLSTGFVSPPDGDTTGYWQQRVAYTIVATLDERAQKVRARGTMRYVNNSPDTLREIYVHQHLNAFRPHSKWSRVDEREGRDRFQHLEEPHYGYERFTAPVRVDGRDVTTAYPGAPDSTVARFALHAPLPPGDSILVEFQWDARASALPRRQGRRRRHWDLAQWYPRVAVYDRGGWQFNALQPAGEFYGEYGEYDVTLIVANDQVVAATGVPVSGDPGWRRVTRSGSVHTAANAYGDVGAPPLPSDVPANHRAVRFVARNVHHFAWTASPDYRYEGGILVRNPRPMRFRTWDTVSLHVLYRPGDDTTWGGGRVLQRSAAAMQWLEDLYGPYAYPQMTIVHRIEGGGTEFPMMQMNGSPSQGLILHEGGHVWTHGILGNNEWRSGWLDEGLSSYQTAWAQSLTPQERVRQNITSGAPDNARGYRKRAARMQLPRFEVLNVDQARDDLLGRSEPIGTAAHEFRDFGTYNSMIYDRAEVMYGQLRDVLGDSVFTAFLRDYYARWALRHVDERAMRASAERLSGRNLAWFFDQWVYRTGVMDYSLKRVRTQRDAAGNWVTEATVKREGEYAHPMNVGVLTGSGWTIGRMTQEPYDEEVVRITTAQAPIDVRLDPHHVTFDWDRRNDRQWGFWGAVKFVFDWPFLDQTDRERRVLRYRPTLWYSETGGVAIGASERGNYLGFAHRSALDVAIMPDASGESLAQFHAMLATGKNPDWRVGAGLLDDIRSVQISRSSEYVAGVRRREIDVAFSAALPKLTRSFLLPETWEPDNNSVDLGVAGRWHIGSVDDSYWFIRPSLHGGVAGDDLTAGYGKAELAVGRVTNVNENLRISARAYGGGTFGEVPPQRALYLSAADPVATIRNHWWRPYGAILKRPNVNYLPLGGPALRAFHWSLGAERAVGGNAEIARRMFDVGSGADTAGVWLTAFGDAAAVPGNDLLNDAGIGIAVRGRIYDRPISLRFDFPIWASNESLTLDQGRAGRGKVAPRWAISFTDIW